MASLFQLGDFTLRSGAKSKWKIECDVLTKDDWEGLAAMASELLPPFGAVLGVPRGGIPFADALRKYSTERPSDPLLFAEDVCTTGGSMERYRDEVFKTSIPLNGDAPKYFGVCVFARRPDFPLWLVPLFSYDPRALMARVAKDIAIGMEDVGT